MAGINVMRQETLDAMFRRFAGHVDGCAGCYRWFGDVALLCDTGRAHHADWFRAAKVRSPELAKFYE